MCERREAIEETKEAMVAIINRQIAGEPPTGEVYILEGFTNEELETIKMFVQSFY